MRARNIVLCLAVLGGLGCAGNGVKDVISASGTIETVEVHVASKVSGQLLELAVEEGSRVKPGDKLAVVDHEALDIQLRQAEAGVRLAEAQLALLVKGARSEDIRQAEAVHKQAEAALTVAEDDARRMRELVKTGSVTPKQREDAEARLTIATAQRNASAEALNKVRTLARPEEIRAGEARFEQAQAAADLLKKTIADCTILAPGGGVVTHKAVEPGELVTPGATIVTLAELDSVYVMIYVASNELGRVRLGGPAEIKIDSFPERVFEGTVTYISPEAEFTPKNVQTAKERVKLVYRIKITLANPKMELKPGMPADAVIETPVVSGQ